MTVHDIPVLIAALILNLVILDTYILLVRYFDEARVNDNEKDV
jgi:hypothetical protein